MQLRDKDAKHFLETRDYDLIKLVLNKFSTKISMGDLFEIVNPICHSYRQYNPAYFEEVLLDLKATIDARVA
jgi:hypothetical protein